MYQESPAQMFTCEFCETFQNTFLQATCKRMLLTLFLQFCCKLETKHKFGKIGCKNASIFFLLSMPPVINPWHMILSIVSYQKWPFLTNLNSNTSVSLTKNNLHLFAAGQELISKIKFPFRFRGHLSKIFNHIFV